MFSKFILVSVNGTMITMIHDNNHPTLGLEVSCAFSLVWILSVPVIKSVSPGSMLRVAASTDYQKGLLQLENPQGSEVSKYESHSISDC